MPVWVKQSAHFPLVVFTYKKALFPNTKSVWLPTLPRNSSCPDWPALFSLKCRMREIKLAFSLREKVMTLKQKANCAVAPLHSYQFLSVERQLFTKTLHSRGADIRYHTYCSAGGRCNRISMNSKTSLSFFFNNTTKMMQRVGPFCLHACLHACHCMLLYACLTASG